ncbi:MAG: hypothetical protein NTV51_30435 [Verrucomicrobia bacterium]|nr:hypothetical protein [Verrucomicrobiota bacterium]
MTTPSTTNDFLQCQGVALELLHFGLIGRGGPLRAVQVLDVGGDPDNFPQGGKAAVHGDKVFQRIRNQLRRTEGLRLEDRDAGGVAVAADAVGEGQFVVALDDFVRAGGGPDLLDQGFVLRRDNFVDGADEFRRRGVELVPAGGDQLVPGLGRNHALPEILEGGVDSGEMLAQLDQFGVTIRQGVEVPEVALHFAGALKHLRSVLLVGGEAVGADRQLGADDGLIERRPRLRLGDELAAHLRGGVANRAHRKRRKPAEERGEQNEGGKAAGNLRADGEWFHGQG